jgi:HD-GYP domain-containing protein (c-di-GMP phosphodiesterase class II)
MIGGMSTTPNRDSAAFAHVDALAAIEEPRSLGEKLAVLHAELRRRLPFVTRVAVATYDEATGLVKAFAHSTHGTSPLPHYEAPLSQAPGLRAIVETQRPRVLNDLETLTRSTGEHNRRLREHGYAASYTLPLAHHGVLWGFVFFDAHQANVFSPERLRELDVWGHLIGALATRELMALRLLVGALRTAVAMVSERDPETGVHLERMARFARLIGHELARSGVHELDDEYVEHLFLFAPLHDVGKIGIPDRILLKQASLSDEEREVMRTHSERGARLIDSILENFRLGTLPFMNVLRNVAELHHEALDGTGYPRQLRGNEVPLEARIVAVADVFDALTSARPYKPAWSNEAAFAELRELAQTQLDADCVEALVRCRDEVEAIQARFREGAQ